MRFPINGPEFGVAQKFRDTMCNAKEVPVSMEALLKLEAEREDIQDF